MPWRDWHTFEHIRLKSEFSVHRKGLGICAEIKEVATMVYEAKVFDVLVGLDGGDTEAHNTQEEADVKKWTG